MTPPEPAFGDLLGDFLECAGMLLMLPLVFGLTFVAGVVLLTIVKVAFEIVF